MTLNHARGQTRRRPRFAAAVAVTLLLLTSGSCSRPSEAPQGPNVLMLVVDTLRADHLGAYGSPWRLTPHLDRLAAQGVTFRHTVAQGSNTINSSPSLLASVYPSEHGYYNYTLAVSPDHVTLAEVLNEAGYETFAVSTNPHVSARNGLAQGFDTFIDDARWTNAEAEQVNSIFLDWLDRRDDDRPWFTLLWYIDPHVPYEPPEDLTRKHLVGEQRALVGPRTVHPGLLDLSAEEREVTKRLYRGEVESFDRSFGALRRALEQRGLFDDTLLLFTSDHGESFWERRGPDGSLVVGHGSSLYDEQTRIPLLVRPPGHAGGVVVESRVDSIDIAPTLLDLLGLERPLRETPFRGISLVPLMAGRSHGADHPPSVSQLIANVRTLDTATMTAVETDDGKVVITERYRDQPYAPPLIELLDPGQGDRGVSVAPGSTAERRRDHLLGHLRSWHAGLRPIPPDAVDKSQDDAELIERLKSLGYL